MINLKEIAKEFVTFKDRRFQHFGHFLISYNQHVHVPLIIT